MSPTLRECVCIPETGGGAERERERISSRLHDEHITQDGAQSHDPEIMT